MLLMIDATPTKYDELAKARMKALWCPSPAYAEGRLFVRTDEGVTCYDLTGKVQPKE